MTTVANIIVTLDDRRILILRFSNSKYKEAPRCLSYQKNQYVLYGYRVTLMQI